MSRLMPQNPDDWPQLVYATNPRPDQSVLALEEFRRRLKQYVMKLGPLPTADIQEVRSAVERAHFANDHSPAGPQRCVVVDGAPYSGKTYATLNAAVSETRGIWDSNGGMDGGGHRSIPWTYLEVPKGGGLRSMATDVARCLGVPTRTGRGENSSDMLARIRYTAPRVGLRGVIVDDSHGVFGASGARNRQSSDLADTLKSLVTGIPATVVVVGAGLRESSLFDNLYGRQIEERSEWVSVGGWAPPTKNDFAKGCWAELVAALHHARVLPESRSVRLNSRRTLTDLANGSQGCPGAAIRWLKRATVWAIDHDTDLDRAALEATA